MKAFYSILILLIPFLGYNQILDFGFEGPSPSNICQGDSAALYLFYPEWQLDTPYTITYSINGVMQTPLTDNNQIIYVSEPGQYIIHTWSNSSGTYNSLNSNLPFPNITIPTWSNFGNLSVNSYSSNKQQHTICNGDSIIIGNNTYYTSGNYIDTIFASCDIINSNINVEEFTSEILGVSNVSFLQIETYSVAQNINSNYEWNLDDGGNIINGINSNLVEIQWGNNSGLFELYVVETNKNGCSDTSYLNINIGNSMSINEHSSSKLLVKSVDIFGRQTNKTNQILFKIYDDGTVEKKIIIE